MTAHSVLARFAHWTLFRWIEFTDFRALRNAACHPAETQSVTLARILERVSRTPLGAELGIRSDLSYEQFRKSVPITNFEFYRKWIDVDVQSGTASLTPTPPLLYVQTSGTTSKSKLIPVTDWTVALAHRAQRISSFVYARDIPGAFAGKILAITSPAREGETPGRTPVGSMSGVVSGSMPSALRLGYVVPPWVLALLNYDLKYKLIALYALRETNISLFASANPSTFLRMLQVIEECHEQLLEVIATGELSRLDVSLTETLPPDELRASIVRRILHSSSIIPASELWPALRAIITWTSGNCAMALSKLMRHCASHVRVAEMGYLSSEFRGTITVDCNVPGGLPPLSDTFFEFLEENSWNDGREDTALLHELERGKRYQILATTGDGLLRYHIHDLIEVTGMFENSPLIRFVQKGKGVTNLTGEKLSEFQVIEAMQSLATEHAMMIPFFLVHADQDEVRYEILLEETERVATLDPGEIAAEFDSILRRLNCEYDQKRKSSRLNPPVCVIVPRGFEEQIRRTRIAEGQRESQLKICRLEYKRIRSDSPFPETSVLKR